MDVRKGHRWAAPCKSNTDGLQLWNVTLEVGMSTHELQVASTTAERTRHTFVAAMKPLKDATGAAKIHLPVTLIKADGDDTPNVAWVILEDADGLKTAGTVTVTPVEGATVDPIW